MFGISGNKQAPIAPQDASMLDNVNSQDLSDMSPPQAIEPTHPVAAAATPPKPVGHPLGSASTSAPAPKPSSPDNTSHAPAVLSVSSSTPATPTVVNDSSPSDPVFTVGAVESPAAPAAESASPATETSGASPSGPVSPPPAISSVSSPAAPAAVAAPAPGKEDVDKEKLAGMKQQALDHLEPLVEHLDQSPEEQFKTTMMMIQANDNHTLLDKALAAAKNITDDKARAQAMLDIINEINYFSQVAQQQNSTS